MWQARVALGGMLWRLLLAIGFVGLGIAIMASGGWVASLIGGANILLFGGFAVLMLATLRRYGTVAIDISPAGLWWRQWSDHPIDWVDVTRAAVVRQRRQPYLCLWLAAPPRWRSGLTAKFAAISNRMGFGDVALQTIGTDRRFDELVDAVARYVPVER